jgi:hypothetical protein
MDYREPDFDLLLWGQDGYPGRTKDEALYSQIKARLRPRCVSEGVFGPGFVLLMIMWFIKNSAFYG